MDQGLSKYEDSRLNYFFPLFVIFSSCLTPTWFQNWYFKLKFTIFFQTSPHKNLTTVWHEKKINKPLRPSSNVNFSCTEPLFFQLSTWNVRLWFGTNSMQYKHAQILEFLSMYIVLNYPSWTQTKSKWSSLSVYLPALTLCTSCSALAALGSCKCRRKSNSLFNSSTYGGKFSTIGLSLLIWVMQFKGGLAVKIRGWLVRQVIIMLCLKFTGFELFSPSG